MSTPVKVSRIASLPVTELGESPVWDEEKKALLYIDIPAGVLHRYFPSTGRHQALKVCPTSSGERVTMAVLVEGHPDLLLVSVGRDIGLVEWKTSDPDASETKLVIFASVDSDKEDNCLNDGKCDAQGRLWIGSMGKIVGRGQATPGEGSLYRLSQDLKPTVVLPKTTLSNGLAWNSDLTRFYFVDSSEYKVYGFDYDDAAGTISNQEVLFDYKANNQLAGFPDGLTTDVEGHIYVASFGGKAVLKLSPEGKLLSSIEMPVQNPTCPGWGGADYSTMYVTTTVLGMTEEEIKSCPDAGGVFEVTGTSSKGEPHFKAKISSEIIEKFKQQKKEQN